VPISIITICIFWHFFLPTLNKQPNLYFNVFQNVTYIVINVVVSWSSSGSGVDGGGHGLHLGLIKNQRRMMSHGVMGKARSGGEIGSRRSQGGCSQMVVARVVTEVVTRVVAVAVVAHGGIVGGGYHSCPSQGENATH